MIRINLVMLVAVLVSALYLVHLQYESRRLYTELDQARSQARRLEAEHEQLQVQRRAQARPERIQQLAVTQLQMRAADPGISQYVNAPTEPVQAGQGAVGGQVRSGMSAGAKP